MEVASLLIWSHESLNKLNIPHALIGGMALSEYGYGRATQDVDWLIPEEFKDAIESFFLNEGFTIFHSSPDVLQLTGKAELDFIIARRPISRGMIENALYSKQLNLPVVLIEDLIGLKIQAYAGNPKRKWKELSDIQELIERTETIDWSKVKLYADHFHEWPTLEKMKSEVK